jgi:hypothetical protein
MPALLVALRGDAALYREAVEQFSKRNTFALQSKNEWKTGDMTISSLHSIRRLQVDFWYGVYYPERKIVWRGTYVLVIITVQ